MIYGVFFNFANVTSITHSPSSRRYETKSQKQNLKKKIVKTSLYPADMYLLKVKNRNTGTRCELCSKLKMKIPEQRLGVVLMSLLLTLNIFHTLFYSFSIVSFEHVNASWVFIFSIKLYTHTLRKNKLNKEQFIYFAYCRLLKTHHHVSK